MVCCCVSTIAHITRLRGLSLSMSPPFFVLSLSLSCYLSLSIFFFLYFLSLSLYLSLSLSFSSLSLYPYLSIFLSLISSFLFLSIISLLCLYWFSAVSLHVSEFLFVLSLSLSFSIAPSWLVVLSMICVLCLITSWATERNPWLIHGQSNPAIVAPSQAVRVLAILSRAAKTLM